MVCPQKVFCDFLEEPSFEKKKALVRRFRKGTTERSKGMIMYYGPALQLMRGRVCPNGTLTEKLALLREKCVSAKSTDKLNNARIESNTLVFKAFHERFGTKKLRVFSSPRLLCILSPDVAVSIHPELYAEVDGVPMVWKLHLSKNPPSDETIRYLLQMTHRGLRQKGLGLPIQQVCFLDLRTGRLFVETSIDNDLVKKLQRATNALAEVWDSAA